MFDKILRDQNFGRDDINWCRIMMARGLFDVNELDGWQAIFFLRGVAGSGKSTLLKLLSEFYPAHNIGSIMSDGQRDFFDEHLIDKLLVIAMDADNSTTWSRTRFNSYASGEMITINRKNKMALSKMWTAHIFMASNCFPSFPDEGGNVARRFVMFLFETLIRRNDGRLFEKLLLELPLIILKSVLAYHDASVAFGQKGIWDEVDGRSILPEMCIRAKKEFLSVCSPFEAFFQSGRLVFDPSYSMTLAALRTELHAFVRERNESGGSRTKGPRLDKVSCGAIFMSYGVRFCKAPNDIGQMVDMLEGVQLVAAGGNPGGNPGGNAPRARDSTFQAMESAAFAI